MIALIDADILIYRVGFTTQSEYSSIATSRIDSMIQSILEGISHLSDSPEHIDYKVFLTDTEKSNFRFTLFPEYKAGRAAEKPRHYDLLRNHLIIRHAANVSDGQEADDDLGIAMTTHKNDKPILCSIDKDLNQIPGIHYDFVKQILYTVIPIDGIRWFYKQLLIGDVAVDNVRGIYGLGPVKVGKLLDNIWSEARMQEIVKQEYQRTYGDEWEAKINLAGQLLKIRQTEGELWQFPKSDNTAPDLKISSPTLEPKPDSILSTNPDDLITSTPKQRKSTSRISKSKKQTST